MARIKGMVMGMGYNSQLYPTIDVLTREPMKSYTKWHAMLTRCLDKKIKESKPWYKMANVDEVWLDYSNFHEWYGRQYKEDDWHLDKDILVKGNTIYGPDTCCMVPREINNLFIIKKKTYNETLPVGIILPKGRGRYYVKCCGFEGERKYLGQYGSLDEAFAAYKGFKEDVIQRTANKYIDKIREDVYYSLMNYKVEMED